MAQAPEQNEQTFENTTARRFSYQEIFLPIWRNRKRIALISFVVAIVTLASNFFLLPLYYQATATLLPETEKGKLSALGEFAGVAQLAGVSVRGSEVARLYPSIVTSETLLRSVIEKKYQTNRFSDPADLMQYFELDEATLEEKMDKALRRLRGLLSASYDAKTGMVTLTMEMREPQLAADVLNTIVAGLDNFMRLKKATNASEQRKWIDERMQEVEHELHGAEEALKTFREKNRRVSDSPQLLLEQERLAREVQVKSTIYIELKKQFELAKIEEIKNITIVNVLDPARAPIRKSRPKRATNAAIMFLLTLVGTSGFYAIRALYGERIREFFAPFKGRTKTEGDDPASHSA